MIPDCQMWFSSWSVMTEACFTIAPTPFLCSCWNTLSWKLRKRMSPFANISNGCLLSRRIILCSPHNSMWIVAGGYSLPSFLLTSMVKRESHLSKSAASWVNKMSCGQRSFGQEEFLAFNKSFLSPGIIFLCFLVQHPSIPFPVVLRWWELQSNS